MADLLKKAFFTLLVGIVFSGNVLAREISHFEKGLDMFNESSYEMALEEFKASLDENPKSVESRFYYALSLYYLDRYRESWTEFRRIAEENKDSPWGQSALSYAEAIDLGIYAPAPEKELEFLATLSYDSDDNVSYNPSLVAAGSNNKTTGMLSATYKPTILSYKLLSLSCSIYSSDYEKNINYDESGSSGYAILYSPFLLGSYIGLTYGTSYNYQKYEPYYSSDYTEGRLTFQVLPENFAWTSIYMGTSNYKYKLSSYSAYDSDNFTYGIKQNLNLLLYCQYEGKYSDTRFSDFSYRSDEYSFGATAPFLFMHKISIIVKYLNKNFLYEDSIGLDDRHDTSYVFDTIISKDINRNFNFSLKYSATTYTSNLDKTQTSLGYGSYLDHILSLSISYKF